MQINPATRYVEPIAPNPVAALRQPQRPQRAPQTFDAAPEARIASEQTNPPADPKDDPAEEELRKAFYSFVGQTLFGQLLQAMRKTVGRPAYFYGSRVESIFQRQLDQVLAEKIGEASADRLAEPMFELFSLRRS